MLSFQAKSPVATIGSNILARATSGHHARLHVGRDHRERGGAASSVPASGVWIAHDLRRGS
jgi:hypothetical protein